MSIIGNLLVKIGAKTTDLEQGLDKAERKVDNFGKNVNRIGGTIAGAFAISKISSFAKEVSQLAGKAEGIETAFRRIGGMAYMKDLKEATRGTVSELGLMEKVVQASNFGLPVKRLAGLFEFASRRAQETGMSVEYLTNSIVLGIGRKSPLILDNLGISAIELRQKLKGVGTEAATVGDVTAAVERIASEAMSKMGKSIITTSDQYQIMNAQIDDIKENIGTELNKIALPVLEKINKALKGINGTIEEDAWSKLGESAKEAAENADGGIGAVKKVLDGLNDEVQKNLDIMDSYGNEITRFLFGGKSEYEAAEKNIEKLNKALSQFYGTSNGGWDDAAILKFLKQINEEGGGDKTVTLFGKIKEEIENLKQTKELLPEGALKELAELNVELAAAEKKLKELNELGLNSIAPELPKNRGEEMPQVDNGFDYINDAEIDWNGWLDGQQNINEGFKEIIGTMDELLLKVESLSLINQAAESFQNSMMEAAANSEEGIESFGNTVGNVARKTIRVLLATAVANVMSKALESMPPPYSLILAAASGAAAAALFNSAVPKFATGGIIEGASLTGDRTQVLANGGEMILNKGQQNNLLKMANGLTGGGGNVEFRIKGRDLYGVISKYSNQLNTTG